MDWKELVGLNWSLLIDGLSNDVHDSAEGGWAHGHFDGVAGVDYLLAAHKTLGGVESNRPDVVASQVLGNFQNQSVLDPLYFQGVENSWQVAIELHIDYCANDL